MVRVSVLARGTRPDWSWNWPRGRDGTRPLYGPKARLGVGVRGVPGAGGPDRPAHELDLLWELLAPVHITEVVPGVRPVLTAVDHLDVLQEDAIPLGPDLVRGSRGARSRSLARVLGLGLALNDCSDAFGGATVVITFFPRTFFPYRTSLESSSLIEGASGAPNPLAEGASAAPSGYQLPSQPVRERPGPVNKD
jgi:hypothetical protein